MATAFTSTSKKITEISSPVGFYCPLIIRKRRSHPDFKRKLREKRKAASKASNDRSGPQLPDFSDQEAVQRFFLQEVQLGEELLANGDITNGVEHLALAVAVCGQPHSLLSVLQQTLPPQIYQVSPASVQSEVVIKYFISAAVTKPRRCTESREAARQLQHDVLHDERPTCPRRPRGGGRRVGADSRCLVLLTEQSVVEVQQNIQH